MGVAPLQLAEHRARSTSPPAGKVIAELGLGSTGVSAGGARNARRCGWSATADVGGPPGRHGHGGRCYPIHRGCGATPRAAPHARALRERVFEPGAVVGFAGTGEDGLPARRAVTALYLHR